VTGERTAEALETELRLNGIEAYCVACVLEKWIDRIDLLDMLDGNVDVGGGDDYHRRDTASSTEERSRRRSVDADGNGRSDKYTDESKIAQLRTFVLQTLGHTVQELRVTGTFSALRLANDSMLQTVRDERRLDAEHAANRKVLNALRNKKKRRKQRHNVSNDTMIFLQPLFLFSYARKVLKTKDWYSLHLSVRL